MAFELLGLGGLVAFTTLQGRRSQAVMEKLGMCRSREIFEHPSLPEGHPLRLHCLYRLIRERWLAQMG